jgi:ribose transport system permease protein
MKLTSDEIKKTWKKIPCAYCAVILLMIIYTTFTDHFLSTENFINLIQQATLLAILSLGMTLVILTMGIDLSAGMIATLCGVVVAVYLKSGGSILGSVFVSIAVGASVGLFNGIFVSVFRMPPFVVTFGSMGMCVGLSLAITNASSIPGLGESFMFIANGFVYGIPFPLIILIILLALVYIILYHTRLGTYIFSLGGNEEAVRLAGINAVFYKGSVYVIAGILYSIGALIMTARMNSAHPLVGFGMEFEAIVAVVIGGTAFTQGKGGNPIGTIMGAATIAILKNGMQIMDVHPSIQIVFVGAFLILALIYDTFRERVE